MKLTSSREDEPQVDGRRWLHEVYADAEGIETSFDTLIDAKTDINALVKDRLFALDEAEANRQPPDPLLLKLDAVRDAYDRGDMAFAKQGLGEAVSLANAKVDG